MSIMLGGRIIASDKLNGIYVDSELHQAVSIANRQAEDTEFEEDGKYRILRVGNLFSNPKWYSSNLELEDDKYCDNGDLLYAWSMSYGPYIWNGEKVIYHYHIWKAKLLNNLSKRFAYYYLIALSDSIKSDVHETTMSFITMKSMNNSYIAFPEDIFEQQAIADYLDETCSKIDEIIAEAKASIDEYKELKQSVIFEAVTKGLDKNAEMKDSGYDFIGNIPSKWEMCKVRHLGTAQNGISIGGDAFGSGHPFVSYGDVYKNYSLPKTVDKLVQSSEEDRKRYSVEKGDWFFTRTSETIEEVGFSCVCEETIPDAVFAGFLIRVRPFNNRIYTGFAKYYFRSNHLRTFFVKEMNLVTRASLAQGLLKDAPVVVPPYDEQIEIANYLENKCEIIDGVIKDKESTINDLEAYKKSLIYEVVTGKRRVV